MSLTLQLLRMDAEDVWTRHRQRRQHNAASAAAAEAKPEAAVNCAKVVAEAPHSYCKSTLIIFYLFVIVPNKPCAHYPLVHNQVCFEYVLYQFPAVNCYFEFPYIILRYIKFQFCSVPIP